jgi:hypothetical protein
MPVALLPPITGSGPSSVPGVPLIESERYARTRAMSRWHRIRSGYEKPDGNRTLNLWCGTFIWTLSEKAGPPLLVDDLPDGEPACAVCVGKALGAGQDETPAGMPLLRFDPRWLTPPPLCPGSGDSGLWVDLARPSQNVVVCLACGDVVAGRACGSPYNPKWGATRHAPGEHLVEPCPFHAWNHLVRRGDAVGCACGWDVE